MVDARAVVAEDVSNAARRETDLAVIEEGYPYRARCLYWEAVGASVTQILPGVLTAETVAVLTGPYCASGAVLPG